MGEAGDTGLAIRHCHCFANVVESTVELMTADRS